MPQTQNQRYQDSLPLELWLSIVQKLSIPDKKSLSLTNQQFRALLVPLIFQTIRISAKLYNPYYRPSLPQRLLSSKKLVRKIDSILTYRNPPEVLACFRTALVTGSFLVWESGRLKEQEYPTLVSNIERILFVLPNLTTLDLHKVPLTTELERWLLIQHALADLTISDCPDAEHYNSGASVEGVRALALTRLTLKNQAPYSVLKRVVASTSATLISITIHGWRLNAKNVALLASNKIRLNKLKLAIYDNWLNPNIHAVLEALSPTLTVLELWIASHGHDMYNYQYSGTGIVKYSHHILPRLHTLHGTANIGEALVPQRPIANLWLSQCTSETVNALAKTTSPGGYQRLSLAFMSSNAFSHFMATVVIPGSLVKDILELDLSFRDNSSWSAVSELIEKVASPIQEFQKLYSLAICACAEDEGEDSMHELEAFQRKCLARVGAYSTSMLSFELRLKTARLDGHGGTVSNFRCSRLDSGEWSITQDKAEEEVQTKWRRDKVAG